MSFIDEITSAAMELMNPLSGGSSAIALEIDAVTANSEAYLQNTINNIVYEAATEVETLYAFLTLVIDTYPEGSPIGTGVAGTGFLQLQDAVDIRNAMVAVTGSEPTLSIYGMYDPIVTNTQPQAFERMKNHAVDVKTNLPDIMKIAGTANALRSATTYVPVGDTQPPPSSCSQDGDVVAEITAGIAPASASAVSEVAGTASAEGDAMQNKIFACTDELIAAINVGSTGSATDPTWSSTINAKVGSMNTLATTELAQGIGYPGYTGSPPITWVEGSVIEFQGWETEVAGWATADRTDIVTQQTCTGEATTELDEKITSERANAGLPVTDSDGLVPGDPGADTAAMNLATSDMVTEIKSKAYMASATSFASNPCGQSIAERCGQPAMSTMGSVKQIAIQPPPEADEAASDAAVAETQEIVEEESASTLDTRKAALIATIENGAHWESRGYNFVIRQTRGTDLAITFVISYTINGTSDVKSYTIPPDSLVPTPDTGESVTIPLLADGRNTATKTFLTGVYDAFVADADWGDANADEQIKFWVMKNHKGFYKLVWVPKQDVTFDMSIEITSPTPKKLMNGFVVIDLWPTNPKGYITRYIESLNSEAELDEYEANILPSITITV